MTMELSVIFFFMCFLDEPEAVIYNLQGHPNKLLALEALLALSED